MYENPAKIQQKMQVTARKVEAWAQGKVIPRPAERYYLAAMEGNSPADYAPVKMVTMKKVRNLWKAKVYGYTIVYSESEMGHVDGLVFEGRKAKTRMEGYLTDLCLQKIVLVVGL